jgi:hypothetical protein
MKWAKILKVLYQMSGGGGFPPPEQRMTVVTVGPQKFVHLVISPRSPRRIVYIQINTVPWHLIGIN